MLRYARLTSPFIDDISPYFRFNEVYCALLGIVSAVSAQLCPLQNAYRGPLMVIYKKSYVMLHLKAEWPSKKYPNCRHNFGRTRTVARFQGLGVW